MSTGQSREDVFQISAFSSFEPWDLVRDVFGADSESEAAELLDTARQQAGYLKITFFPWVARAISRRIAPQAAITSGDPESESSSVELLAAYSTALGVRVHSVNPSAGRPVVYVDASAEELSLDQVRRVNGVRRVGLAPLYSAVRQPVRPMFIAVRGLAPQDVRIPEETAPIVGVLDSGVAGSRLNQAIVGQEEFNVPGDSDPSHGTFVAGLVIDSHGLNEMEPRFPRDQARVFSASVLPRGSIHEPILFQRIVDAINAAPPGVRVWNCSFGADPFGEPEYGTFAQDLDELSDSMGLLFVQAAGNFGPPGRPWPPEDGQAYDDGIASPSEAIRGLAVGARAHKGGAVPSDAPSSYSRRGPSFAQHVKPEVAHWAGDVDERGSLSGFGVQSVLPSDELGESVGTSFSTPIVSSIAANVWAKLEASGATDPRPELIKGLLVHDAILGDTVPDPVHRHYYGWGVPQESSRVLADLDTSFTTVHEVVLTPGNDWIKRPFPVPASLLTEAGGFRGEVFLTISYAPPINAAFGSEAVRYDVSGAFGYVDVGADGREHFHSVTPQQSVVASSWESDQILDGKWSPLKSHRARYPQGRGRGEWALRLSLTERVSEEVGLEQRVFAIVTFRPVQPGVAIYHEGLQATRSLSYVHRTMLAAAEVRVRGRG